MIAAFSGVAGAEMTLPVNDNNTGIFDQPSVAMNGSKALVAYIGDNAAPGVFKVYFAAVNGDTNFANLSLVKDSTVILTSPIAVDNAVAPNDAYYDARHPKIILRSSTEAVILFQAKPTAPDTIYQPYIARVTLSVNTVTAVSVRRIVFPLGVFDTVDIEELSFGIVTADNTARVAFSTRSAIGASEPFQVYFARVGLDNASVVGTPIPLSTLPATDGLRPLPSLRLDTLNRAHVAWAADNAFLTGPVPVYYAMIKETNGIDNRVIAATQVIGGGFRWGFPSLQVFSNSSIVVLAADETVPGQAGNIGFINFNPDGDNQDGSTVIVADNRNFFITPPGELILPDEFNLYRPDAVLDTSGRLHMTGYGAGGTRCTYYAFHLIATFPYYEILTPRAQVGFDSQEFPREITGDYTRGAFGYISGKAIVFWSGSLTPGAANRNLDVSTVATTTLPIPFKESGCSMVSDPGAGEIGRMAGTAFLFLPAIVLGILRISRGRRSARRSAVA